MTSDILLEKVMERLLREELVSVKRFKAKEQTYDVQFDDKTGNISGRPAHIPQRGDPAVATQHAQTTGATGDLFAKYLQLQDAYPKTFSRMFGRIPQAELINFLNSTKREILKDPPLPGDMAKLFDSETWLSTLDWPTPGNVGKGEQQLRIAFRALDEMGGIDFPAPWGGVSVKYVGSGGSYARSGESSLPVRVAIVEFKKAIFNDEIPKESFYELNATQLGALIDKSLKSAASRDEVSGQLLVDDQVIKGYFSKLSGTLGKLKFAIASEHDARGVIFVSDGGAMYLPANRAARAMRVQSLLSESRVSIVAPLSMGGGRVRTFESVIGEKKNEWMSAGR